MGRKELAEELRTLRKSSGQKSVSSMKMYDIMSEIEKLKNLRATTPANGSYTSDRSTPKSEAKIKDVKKAKEAEFPVEPVKGKATKGVVSVSKKSESKPVVGKEKATIVRSAEKVSKKPVKKSKKAEAECNYSSSGEE